MELYGGVHRIGSLYGGRDLFQYLFTGKRTVLVDSGVAETPGNTIIPYIEVLGLDPAQLTMVITTHPDADHQGGNAKMREAAPGALIACGELDRHLVEDPACLYAERYNFMKRDHHMGFEDEPSPDAGTRCRVDVGFRGGESIVLDDGWELEVLSVAGHSSGHLALYDRAHKAAFVSDAVHGRGCPKADGSMALPVTYFQVDLYLSTLTHLENLDLEALHTGHWPSMYGDEIRDFISDSRTTVEILDRSIQSALDQFRAGLTIRQLIDVVQEAFPEWPQDTRDLAMFSVKGHLDRLQESGRIRMTGHEPPRRWEFT